MKQNAQEKSELGLEASNPERCLIKFDFFLETSVRGVIAGQDGDRSICAAFDQRIDILLGAQRRIHFKAGVKRADGFVCKRNVMRAELAGDGNSSSAGIAQQADAASRAQMLAMNSSSAELR